MKASKYVTISFTVPQTHADAVRAAMGKAGAGKVGNYSFCSFSVKGLGRFIPQKGAHPHIGRENVPQEVAEEKIETLCPISVLERVLQAIKDAHPYEEMVIDIFPVYDIGRKHPKNQGAV